MPRAKKGKREKITEEKGGEEEKRGEKGYISAQRIFFEMTWER